MKVCVLKTCQRDSEPRKNTGSQRNWDYDVMKVCVLKTKEACLLGPSRFLGNCTKEGIGKEKSGNNEREGEHR